MSTPNTYKKLRIDSAVGEILSAAERTFLAESGFKAEIWAREKTFLITHIHAILEYGKPKEKEMWRTIYEENPNSIGMALHECISVGLTFNPALKRAYLIPYGNKATFMAGYRGYKYLAFRSGDIVQLVVDSVKKSDKFQSNGKTERPIHEYDAFSDRDDEQSIGYYCWVKDKNGYITSHFMSRKKVENVRDQHSAAKKYGPWVTHFEEMAFKTCIHSAKNHWPEFSDGSSDLQNALQVDQNNNYVLDGSYSPTKPAVDSFLAKQLAQNTSQQTPVIIEAAIEEVQNQPKIRDIKLKQKQFTNLGQAVKGNDFLVYRNKILAAAGVETVNELPEDKLDAVIRDLKAKQAKKEEEEEKAKGNQS